jgi:hypothetical protein
MVVQLDLRLVQCSLKQGAPAKSNGRRPRIRVQIKVCPPCANDYSTDNDFQVAHQMYHFQRLYALR